MTDLPRIRSEPFPDKIEMIDRYKESIRTFAKMSPLNPAKITGIALPFVRQKIR